MNMNLPPTVFWSVLVTGSWLIWQTVMIVYKINIFTFLSNWFKDRPIILPAIFFLISPFLSTKIIQSLSESNQNFTGNNVAINTSLTILTTAASIFIGNRYLEGFKQNQEQKKIAKLLIVSIQEHLKHLKQIQDYLKGTLSESDIKIITSKITRITNDTLYKESLSKIGFFPTKILNLVINYAQILNSIIDDTPTNNIYIQQWSKRKIEAIKIEGKLCIMILNKQVVKDQKNFEDFTKSIKEEYCRVKHNNRPGIIDNYIVNEALSRTEKLFEELGRTNELNNEFNQFEKDLEILDLLIKEENNNSQ